MRKLTRADCGTEASSKECQEAQLRMLKTFAEYCDAHGYDYFLSGGTLLGAVRHQGFIPWDDDIDLNMPRPQCEKLLKETQGRIGEYVFKGPDMDKFSRECEFFRLYDMNYVVENFVGGSSKIPHYHPLFIDIFPIEGLPDDAKELKRHYAHLVFLRKMARVASLDHAEGSNVAAHIWHVLAWLPAHAVGYRRWSERIQRVATKYTFDDAVHVGVMTAPVHTVEECVLKSDYMEKTAILFEGQLFSAPGNADVYLTQLYGDYMTLPPEEKRCSHHDFTVYNRK